METKATKYVNDINNKNMQNVPTRQNSGKKPTTRY
jgi:hypothetical protein